MNISVVIPAYNAEKYISKCLDSLNGFYEIIVVNDGSTDKTKSIVSKYKNVRCINIENHGVSYARNLGIKEATGDYIMFVDSDDYIVRDYIKEINLSISGEDVIYFFNHTDNINTKEDIISHIVGIKTPFIAGPYCKLFKRSFLLDNKIEFVDKIINGEDMLFNIMCLSKLKTFKIVNKAIYMYRQALNTATKRFDSNIINSDLMFHKYLIKYLDSNFINKDEKNQIIIFCYKNAIITIVDRAAYLKKYCEFKKVILQVKKKNYINYLNKKSKYTSSKVNIILTLLYLKLYYAVFILLKLKHRKIKKNEFFINF